jgi:hypothetical protein
MWRHFIQSPLNQTQKMDYHERRIELTEDLILYEMTAETVFHLPAQNH